MRAPIVVRRIVPEPPPREPEIGELIIDIWAATKGEHGDREN